MHRLNISNIAVDIINRSISWHGMGRDQISVGWELPVPSRLYARTGMGQDLGGMGAPIPVPRPAYSILPCAVLAVLTASFRLVFCTSPVVWRFFRSIQRICILPLMFLWGPYPPRTTAP